MILANSFNLVYAILSHINWQYIMVDAVILYFLCIQQIQILSDNTTFAIKSIILAIIIFFHITSLYRFSSNIIYKNNRKYRLHRSVYMSILLDSTSI